MFRFRCGWSVLLFANIIAWSGAGRKKPITWSGRFIQPFVTQ